MDPRRELEDMLFEAASVGNLDAVKQLVLEKGVNVNAQHKMNGWSALHWAAKRGHQAIGAFLMEHGADPGILTSKGETVLQVTNDPRVRAMFGGGAEDVSTVTNGTTGFIPNYLAHPPFPYLSKATELPVASRDGLSNSMINHMAPHTGLPAIAAGSDEELVLKARVSNSAETDFIEIELSRNQMTFDSLIVTMCRELEVDRSLVQKVRKLPNTIIRKDKDVKRLRDFNELEVVMTSKAVSQSSRNYCPQPKHIDVVY